MRFFCSPQFCLFITCPLRAQVARLPPFRAQEELLDEFGGGVFKDKMNAAKAETQSEERVREMRVELDEERARLRAREATLQNDLARCADVERNAAARAPAPVPRRTQRAPCPGHARMVIRAAHSSVPGYKPWPCAV